MRRRVLAALFAVAVANAVLFLALVGETTGWRAERDGAYIAVAAGFAAGFGVLTLSRDRFPRTALVFAVLAVCTYYIVGLPSIGVVLPLLVIVTATTLAGHRTFALITVGVLFVVASFFRIRDGDPVEVVLGYELLSNVVLVSLAVALAEVIGTRRALQRSQEHSTRMAAEAARAEADRVQEEDRTRIARELHDQLGHSLAIVSLHANAVSERLPADEPAAESAGHLREAAAQALGQLRSAVRAIGSPTAGSGAEAPAPEVPVPGGAGGPQAVPAPDSIVGDGAVGDDRPAAGLEADERTVTDIRIDEIAARIRGAGLSVDVLSDHARLPSEVAAAAFRIVQEATTNALRHSDPDHIGIALTSGPGPSEAGGGGVTGDDAFLRLRVLNDGATGNDLNRDAGRSEGGGTGLVGLRARAAELGGEVTWGHGERGIFVVDAAFPIGGVAEPVTESRSDFRTEPEARSEGER
ncbi:Signal transduction histidine kinase [Brevibacterium jeotgali]|uniref:histidine kinase n=2 Tax=Brevibacterium jeotgali TaxID=1262550 RepID=A0A2H1L4S3_9MICO|nr:signal transduction histidine kinase [Brevibacterium jeotgali]SMY11908.1 Signal transduction histidine kinase [Brevibacterium jeotgali]